MTVKIERNLSLTEVKNRFLRRVMATKKMQWLQVCTKNQIATQQSGCGLEGAADDMTSAATCPVLIKMHFDKGLGLRLIL